MTTIRWALVFAAGALFATATCALLPEHSTPAVAQSTTPTPDLASLAKELETMRGTLPDQAHAMQDVGYHFSNLWFSGQKRHWKLANFYWLETRSHLRWAVRIIPKRKDNAGQDVDLEKILEAFENGPLKDLEGAIASKEQTAFGKFYRTTLEGCYSCHKASDKPFIRLQIPTVPETSIVNFDPSAEWPK